MKIAVIAGTPVDTRMGVTLLNQHGVKGLSFPVSRTPEEQTAFQVGAQSAREEAVGALLDRIKEAGMNSGRPDPQALSHVPPGGQEAVKEGGGQQRQQKHR